jgi:RimJ/RimL family protein N-acetyltransferase
MRIDLGEGFHLTPVREGDQPAYVEYFRDKEITDFMILIPYPYTQEHAEFWVRHCLEMASQQPHPSEFAIRRPDGFLIGGIGVLLATDLRRRHRGELGYWLTKPYRGRGLMTRTVQAIVAYGFETLGLKRIEATAFAHNPASQRVLERAGLKREGTLAGWHYKDGKLIDAVMFAIVAPPRVG